MASVVAGGMGTIMVVLLVLARWPGLVKLGPLHTLSDEPEARRQQRPA